jgi:hypothetical protein
MRRVFITAAALFLCLVAASCGSDSDDDSTTPGPTGTATEGPCPFDGSTDAQKQEGVEEPTSLTKVTPSVDGCIDSVVFAFAPSLSPIDAKYEDAAAGDSGAVLVLTFAQAELGDGLDAGTTQDPKDLNYVSEVSVADSGGSVEIEITLDKKRPFFLNSSEVPAEAELSIG